MTQRIAVYITSFSDGGVERNMVMLASGFAEMGYATDLLIAGDEAYPFLYRLSPKVNLIRLPQKRRRRLPATVAYLRQASPAIMLSAKQRDDELALAAGRIAGSETRFFLRCGIHLSSRPKMTSWNPLRRWWHYHNTRRLFQTADGAICVSQGVAEDLAQVAQIDMGKIHVVRNPTITPDFDGLSRANTTHPWFEPGQPPVIIGAGALAPVKRFHDLVTAFAGLASETDARLVIFGQGKTAPALEDLARKLGVADRVDLPGYTDNLMAYLRRARLFVLSSEREGSPNVLTEALACGTPVVATDCPSGPMEILAGGKYGALVPIGDVKALRQAMLGALQHPLPAEFLQEAVGEYTTERACTRYLQAFGLLA
ncbi:MAG: glycosyltransferase [Pseudomonadota bacterium]